MLQKRLEALNYPGYLYFDINDTKHFRKVVVWLEDRLIRYYRIEKRNDLRNIESDKWPEVFNTYCMDVKCPITTDPLDQLEWLTRLAIQNEYMNNNKQYKRPCKLIEDKVTSGEMKFLALNNLDNIDFQSDKFQNLVNAIAKILKVTQHPDCLITLKACSKLVSERIQNGQLSQKYTHTAQGTPFPIMEIKCGTSLGDVVLDNAAKCLTLLYIQDLRDLQTKINETIVTRLQNKSAPKTNIELGKIGK